MWVFALKLSEIPPNSGRTVELEGLKLAFFSVDGKVHAISSVCAHRGGPLGEGHLEGKTVTCPWHAWDFDVTTGKCVTMEGAAQKSYRVKLEKGEVFVEL
jgi:nitrite reductase (NADH) small subunit